MPAKKARSTSPAAKKRTSSKGSAKPRSRTAGRAQARQECPTWQDYLTTRRPVGATDDQGNTLTDGQKCIRWIERHCVHTNDRWTGRPFRLLPWQKFVILCLFTVGADGLRVVRWALIGIAKKNGKTELLAALALYFAFGPSGPDGQPEPAALVVVAAGSDEQADLLFGAAKTMCELSSTLRRLTEGGRFEDEIQCPSLPGSKIKRVAAAARKTSSTLDGKNVYVAIIDELHCWEGNGARVVWDTITNGTVTRRQPMVLQITTAHFDEDTICGEQYAYGKAVAGGKVDDPRYFFWWVEAPQGADHTDPDVIAASNPSFGITVGIDFYLDQLTKKTEAVFRRYFLNQITESEESWLEHGQWERLSVGNEFSIDPGLPSWTGTDASTKHDSTAHVIAQWNPDTGRLRLRCRMWERPFDPRTRRPVEGWKLPLEEVENYLSDWFTRAGETLAACGYDPALFHRSARALEDLGLPMEEVPQSDARMVPASQNLYQLIVEGKIEHDGDTDFARHLRNAVAVQARGGNGGWRLSKGRTKKHMDAAIAAAIAAWLACQSVDEDDERVREPEFVTL